MKHRRFTGLIAFSHDSNGVIRQVEVTEPVLTIEEWAFPLRWQGVDALRTLHVCDDCSYVNRHPN